MILTVFYYHFSVESIAHCNISFRITLLTGRPAAFRELETDPQGNDKREQDMNDNNTGLM